MYQKNRPLIPIKDFIATEFRTLVVLGLIMVGVGGIGNAEKVMGPLGVGEAVGLRT